MSRLRAVRLLVCEMLEPTAAARSLPKAVNGFMFAVIVLNVIAVILGSFETVNARWGAAFSVFETVSVVIFSAEYILRPLSAELKFPNLSKPRAVLRYLFSFMALVDLCAVLPFYLPMVAHLDLRFLRILRLTRLFRVLKVHRYERAFGLIGSVIRKSRAELTSTLFIVALLLLFASCLMYFVEGSVQPKAFPNIIASFWWAIVTLTTVGCGDVYPVTTASKIIAGVIALLGIGIVAIPTGIISSGFVHELQARREASAEARTNNARYCRKVERSFPNDAAYGSR